MTVPLRADGQHPASNPERADPGRPAMRRTIARLSGATGPVSSPGSLAEQLLGIADTITQVLDHAAAQRLAIPPPVVNSVHQLRGWANRIGHGAGGGPAAVDATRLLAYLRGLPDQQLLALLADLPWARLDALLDAASSPTIPPQPRSPRS